MTDITKQCTGCSQILPVAAFNDSPNGKDFKKSKCKSCEAIYNKSYYALRKEQLIKKKEEMRNNVFGN